MRSAFFFGRCELKLAQKSRRGVAQTLAFLRIEPVSNFIRVQAAGPIGRGQLVEVIEFVFDRGAPGLGQHLDLAEDIPNLVFLLRIQGIEAPVALQKLFPVRGIQVIEFVDSLGNLLLLPGRQTSQSALTILQRHPAQAVHRIGDIGAFDSCGPLRAVRANRCGAFRGRTGHPRRESGCWQGHAKNGKQ